MSPGAKGRPRVTVVMAVYNAAPFVEQAIASVLSQTWSDFELVVVDDASTDGSLALAQSFDDPRIRLIRHERNKGASQSRNDALAAAQGELIAVMDADDVCAPTRLERQVEFLDAHPSVGLVGCGVYDNIDAGGAVLYTSFLPEDNESIQRALMERWCFLHSSIMFRKSAAAGGYRTPFEPVEDHDFILRIVEHAEARNIGERLVAYRLNHNGLTVFGHQYIEELRGFVIRMARRRRSGQGENIEAELPRILALKQKRKTAQGLAGVMQKWRDSLYAANRYYGFGCRELCAGQMARARRCYLQSLRTDKLFVKSWIGLVLTLMPFVARRVRFVFRSSMQQHHDPGWSRRPSDARESKRAASVVHGTVVQ